MSCAAGKGDDKFTFPLWKKIISGGVSGCMGAAIANPTGKHTKSDLKAFSRVPCQHPQCRGVLLGDWVQA